MSAPIPGAPLVAQSGYNSVNLSWRRVQNFQQNNAGQMRYLIFRDGSLLATVKDSDPLSYADTGLADGGSYTYTIAAIDNTGASVQSAGTVINLVKQITAVLLGGLIMVGPGDPTNTVKANPGTLWLRSDGGASTTLYVKESATDKTGWVAK